MCVLVYLQACTSILVYIKAFLHVYMCMYRLVCVYLCMNGMHSHSVCVLVYIQAFTRIHVSMNVCMYMPVRTQGHTHKPVTYTCRPVRTLIVVHLQEGVGGGGGR